MIRLLPRTVQHQSGTSLVNLVLAAPQSSQDKSQGPQYTGQEVAENPRNEVPPASPELRERQPGVPPSPDHTFEESNHQHYSSPGAHPGREGRDGEAAKDAPPNMDNASQAVLQKGNQKESGQGTDDASADRIDGRT